MNNAHELIKKRMAELAKLTPEQRREQLLENQRESERKRRLEEQRRDNAISDALENIGFIAQGLKVMTPEEERQMIWDTKIVPNMAAAGIDSRHRIKLTQWGNDEQESAFQITRDLCKLKGAVVALVGNRGTGKTTIACQIMRERIEQTSEWYRLSPDERIGRHPLDAGKYEKLGRLANMFKPLYSDIGTIQQEALSYRLNNWCNLQLLVLDEIHEGEDLKAQNRFLTDLIDRRYANHRDTIIISNHDPEAFANEINPSILSRISENGAIIPCMWESHRNKH